MRSLIDFRAVWLFVAVMAVVAASAVAAEVPGARGITPAQAVQLLTSGQHVVLVDVRDSLERDVDGHIPNDISVPLEPHAQFPAAIQHALPDKRITAICYCRRGIVGGLSDQASGIMANLGYARTYYISGGSEGWPYQKVK